MICGGWLWIDGALKFGGHGDAIQDGASPDAGLAVEGLELAVACTWWVYGTPEPSQSCRFRALLEAWNGLIHCADPELMYRALLCTDVVCGIRRGLHTVVRISAELQCERPTASCDSTAVRVLVCFCCCAAAAMVLMLEVVRPSSGGRAPSAWRPAELFCCWGGGLFYVLHATFDE